MYVGVVGACVMVSQTRRLGGRGAAACVEVGQQMRSLQSESDA